MRAHDEPVYQFRRSPRRVILTVSDQRRRAFHVRVSIGDPGPKARPANDERGAMCHGFLEEEGTAVVFQAVQDGSQLCRAVGNAPGAAVGHAQVRIHGGEIHAEADVAPAHVHADAQRLEWPAPCVVLIGIEPEDGEVSGVAAGAYAGRDGIHQPVFPLQRQPVQVRGRRCLQRRFVRQIRHGPIAQAVADDDDHAAGFGHRSPPCMQRHSDMEISR
ncbi:MAG: hypothetical protein BWY76_03325 [bacterium ADurb.Bin429]|nr:MAG: hypothetical protein BWY76_03325 [bacterium ADurb.Bin429]